MSGTLAGGGMRRRWISLYVENRVGVLARISGSFSGKAYNIHSLTVGETEDTNISRMTTASITRSPIRAEPRRTSSSPTPKCST